MHVQGPLLSAVAYMQTRETQKVSRTTRLQLLLQSFKYVFMKSGQKHIMQSITRFLVRRTGCAAGQSFAVLSILALGLTHFFSQLVCNAWH